MIKTLNDLEDEINELIFKAWKEKAATIVNEGYEPVLLWEGIDTNELPDNSKFWARVTKTNVNSSQTTFNAKVNQPYIKRYTTYGLIYVQIFMPMSDPKAIRKGNDLGDLLELALIGKTTPSKVIFRNGVLRKGEPENSWLRLNFVCEYEFDRMH